MNERSENEFSHRRLCNFAAVILCIAHILTVCGMAYQSPHKIDHFVVTNFAVWLSPALLPLLVRRSGVLIIICAIPISAIFCARMYFVWQLYSLGINSGGQKGDAAFFATSALGVISIAVFSLWLMARAVQLIYNLILSSLDKSKR